MDGRDGREIDPSVVGCARFRIPIGRFRIRGRGERHRVFKVRRCQGASSTDALASLRRARRMPRRAREDARTRGAVFISNEATAGLVAVGEGNDRGEAIDRDAPSWDVVVVDAYQGHELGQGLSGPGFFRSVRERLRRGGAFAFNVVGKDGSGAVPSVVRAAASVFDDVRVVPVMTATEAYEPSTVRHGVVIGGCGDCR